MKTLYVYILECSDGSYYVGVTNNVGRRFIEHQSGIHETSYTYMRRPLKLVFCREFMIPMEAIKYEKQLKRWSRTKKEALIRNDLESLHELASCKNATSHTLYPGSC
jgi:putative endonuclease